MTYNCHDKYRLRSFDFSRIHSPFTEHDSNRRALLTENGPCKVNADAKTTSLNPYSWTEAAHVLWLDQPAGVGFSYGSETDTNEDMISEDAYWFLQKFLQEHSEFASNPLFIVGESYGGHYAPAIAHRIFTYNKKLPADDAAVLNLAGVAVGNGLTAPEVQYAVRRGWSACNGISHVMSHSLLPSSK